jgi:ectoine hydroxylase-related dioxygenase (phytanoyl-CoA dioxygenase family)
MKATFSIRDQILEDGFAIVPEILDSSEIAHLKSSLEALGQSESIRRRGGVFAVRNLLDVFLTVRELANSSQVREIVDSILGHEAFAVRGILFDKTPEANWKVPWHQDVTIAVAAKQEVDGFGPWSIKAGVNHVQPPSQILENMLSVRIHLDPCGEENGALKVVPASHRLGRLPEAEAARIATESQPTICSVNAGDALLMRPLLLHASSASEAPHHRRVIHIDFAANELPSGLRWAVEQMKS